MQVGFTYYQAKNSLAKNILAKLRFKREVIKITNGLGIEGFTLLKALGAWQGKTEPSYQMLLVGVEKETVVELAKRFRDRFEQDAVMIQDGTEVLFI